MAGPDVSILFRGIDHAMVEDAMLNVVGLMSSSVDGSNFQVVDTEPINGKYHGEPRPFSFYCGDPASDVELGDDVLYYEQALGWWPSLSLGLIAMCNGRQDHQVLGELTLFMAAKYDGLLAIPGPCDSFCSDKDFANCMQQAPDTVVVHYTEEEYKEYLLTPRVLAEWMQHPSFRMPK